MNSLTVGIIGNGPEHLIPDLDDYKDKVDVWIGADRGAAQIMKYHLTLDLALGDFDSVTANELGLIRAYANQFEQYPAEKNETDMEIAVNQAFRMKPQVILLFGVTGARIDHELINIQLLRVIAKQGVKGIIIDKYNAIEWTNPGRHQITYDPEYETISFIPLTEKVAGITLEGFYYPLEKENIHLGSTRTISNKLTAKSGTFSYDQGILLLIKSSDG